MAKTTYVVQAATRSVWADLLQVTPTPSDAAMLREYRGIAGACAQLNANGVADTPFTLNHGEDNEAPEVSSHPFLETLKKPNPFMGPKAMLKYTQLCLEMTGKAYWKIIPGVLTPVVEIYPLQPHLVSPDLGVNNQITGWKYDKENLSLDQMVQFFCADPMNPYGSGKGPAELAWSEIVLMNSDVGMMTALMQNGGAPSHVLSPKDQQGVVSPTVLARLQAAWQTFRGRGANRLMIPEIPVDLQSLAQTSKEFEGSARYDQLKSTILACFNIPNALFESAGSRAELDAAMVQWSRLAIDPRTTMLEDVINRRIMPLFGEGVNLFFESNLEEDADEAAMAEQGLPTGGPNPSAGTRMNPREEAA